MNNNEEKNFYKKNRAYKEYTENATEDVVYNELFICKNIKPKA